MGENRLAAILEASLKADGLIEAKDQNDPKSQPNIMPVEPSSKKPSRPGRRIVMSKEKESYINPEPKPQDDIMESLNDVLIEISNPEDLSNPFQNREIPPEPKSLETPKFKILHKIETKESKPLGTSSAASASQKSKEAEQKLKLQKSQKPSENEPTASIEKNLPDKIAESPKIEPKKEEKPKKIENSEFDFKFGNKKKEKKHEVAEEDVFEEDKMGEAWEYAMYSANVNEQEESESGSDEFDADFEGEIVIAPKTESEIKKPEKKPEKTNKSKKVDLKTRGIKAQAKLQQMEMKAEMNNEETHEKDTEVQESQVVVNIDEWENVQEISIVEKLEPKKISEDFVTVEITDIKSTEKLEKNLSMEDLEAHNTSHALFYSRNYTVEQALSQIEEIKVSDEVRRTLIPKKKSFFSFFSTCFAPSMPKLDKQNTGERERLLVLSMTDFDSSQSFHLSMIMTVYKIITSSQSECPIIGPHWLEIGFSSNNPQDDLNEIGLAGLLCLLYMVNKYYKYSKQILLASKDNFSGFPWAIALLELARVAISCLKEGRLNKLIGKEKDLYHTFLRFYAGIVLFWFEHHKETKFQFDQFLKYKDIVLEQARRNPQKLLNVAIENSSDNKGFNRLKNHIATLSNATN